MNSFQYIKDVISPRKCYVCKAEGYFFCPGCFQNIEKYTPYCYICKKPSESFNIHKNCKVACNLRKVIVFGKYTDQRLQKLIHDGKYYGRKEVFKDIGKELSSFFLQNHKIQDKTKYLIAPTPMYFLRRWKRGYNHSEVLAREISENLGITYNARIIKKRKYTTQQSRLERSKRLSNLKNAFLVNKKYSSLIKGKVIILVDDVVSTGSTLNELGGLLKLYGAKEVIGLVIASD